MGGGAHKDNVLMKLKPVIMRMRRCLQAFNFPTEEVV